jgi:hypothetical protein
MDFKVFDVYNIRARLSVYIIVIAPMVLTLYILYEPIRSLSFSAIFVAILSAFSNYLFALQRYWQKNRDYKKDVETFLYLEDERLLPCTKQRYYHKLSKIDSNFDIFNTPSNDEDFKNACSSAIQWLINNTRNNKLVQEENMLFGFYKNLLCFKYLGVIVSILSLLVLIVSVPKFSTFFQSKTNISLVTMDIFFVIFWIIGVTEKILSILTEKYAQALFGALDSQIN